MRITLYTPYLQGFYLGELTNQIRQLCALKGYELLIIRTNGFGQYSSEFGLHKTDAVILLRNPVAESLATRALELGLPIVSIGYDYFPLDVPLVSSDHEKGVELIFEKFHYVSPLRMAFIGDISQYDIRKRFESYCENLDKKGLAFEESLFFEAKNAVNDGGEQAAEEFVKRQSDANVVLCGAGLTGIGFANRLKKIAPNAARNISIACFDAIPLIPVYFQEITSIDPNLHLLAYRAINQVEDQRAGKKVAKKALVEPKLTQFDPDQRDDFDPFLATCVDLEALYSPAYVKCIFSNMHEVPRDIANNHLNNLLSLSVLFPRFIDNAVLYRHYKDKKGKHWVKVLKKFNKDFEEPEVIAKLKGLSAVIETDLFKCALQNSDNGQLIICTPIFTSNKMWGFLVIRSKESAQLKSSFLAFTAYLDETIEIFERNLETEQHKKQIQALKDQIPSTSESLENDIDDALPIELNLDTKEYLWSEQALEALDFKSEVEKNIYKHMDLMDRLSPENYDTARIGLNDYFHDGKPVSLNIQLKARRGNYEEFILFTLPEKSASQSNTLKLYLSKSSSLDET